MTIFFQKHLIHFKNHMILILMFFTVLFNLCYGYSNQLIYYLIKPLILFGITDYLIMTDVTEVFYIQVYVTFLVSLLLTLWFVAYQILLFLSTGLYKSENCQAIICITLFFVFFWISLSVCFEYFIPRIFQFFAGFVDPNYGYLYNLSFEPKLTEYLYFIIQAGVWGSFLLHYPFLFLNLVVFKVVRIKWIITYRKAVYFKSWIIATLVSPPDIWSQILISLVFIFFLEFLLVSSMGYEKFKKNVS